MKKKKFAWIRCCIKSITTNQWLLHYCPERFDINPLNMSLRTEWARAWWWLIVLTMPHFIETPSMRQSEQLIKMEISLVWSTLLAFKSLILTCYADHIICEILNCLFACSIHICCAALILWPQNSWYFVFRVL